MLIIENSHNIMVKDKMKLYVIYTLNLKKFAQICLINVEMFYFWLVIRNTLYISPLY